MGGPPGAPPPGRPGAPPPPGRPRPPPGAPGRPPRAGAEPIWADCCLGIIAGLGRGMPGAPPEPPGRGMRSPGGPSRRGAPPSPSGRLGRRCCVPMPWAGANGLLPGRGPLGRRAGPGVGAPGRGAWPPSPRCPRTGLSVRGVLGRACGVAGFGVTGLAPGLGAGAAPGLGAGAAGVAGLGARATGGTGLAGVTAAAAEAGVAGVAGAAAAVGVDGAAATGVDGAAAAGLAGVAGAAAVTGAAGAAGVAGLGCSGLAGGAGLPTMGACVSAGPGRAVSAWSSALGCAPRVSRIFRTTGASSVEDGPRTYSPISLSFPRSSLLVIPTSFAISWTRGLATTLLVTRTRPHARTLWVGCIAHRYVLIEWS